MTLRVIIVDDNAAMREVLRSVVEDLGAEIVAEADNGQAAIKQAELYHPELLLLDITMPGMGGFPVARYLHAHAPQINIIFVSQHNQHTYVEEAFEAGARGYVLKNSLVDDLGPAIETVMNGGTFVSPKINTYAT